MPSPFSGAWLNSPSQQRCKSKPKEVLVTNFDKLFEDDKVRRRAKSCYRSEKIFDRKDDSPVPVIPTSSSSGSRSGSQPRQPPSGVTSYRLVERACGNALLERIARRAVKKSVKEEAEEVRASVLEILPDPWRPLPGRLDIASQGARLEAGLDCDEVVPRVLLASGKTAKNVSYLRDIGVTHIINTASRDVWLPVEKLTNLGLDIFQFHVDDVPSANIAAYFPAVAAFLAKALSEGGLVLVNCLVGFSRSATVLTAALMINNHWSLVRSLRKLRQSRPVKPNLGFMVQLLNLEQKLKNKGDRLI